MKIGILSRGANLYSTRRLRQAAAERGHEVRVVNYLRCYLSINAHRPAVILGTSPLHFDAVIPRIGASQTFYGTAVVRQFETTGVFSINESQAISRARDKLLSMQLLARQGIHLPTTGFASSPKDISGLLEAVGGAPVVIKLLEGTQGLGVVLAETTKAAESVIGAFRQLDADILVQEFIAEAKGADLRALVVGDQVIASMMRQAASGEFRSNLHRGGSATKVELTEEETRLAVRSTQILGLNIAGVDMLRSDHGSMVLEVNASPGLQGIETTTGVDVADKIVEFIEHEAPRAAQEAQT